ncbi:MAG TPA: 50S ribosomal protein L18 [Terriglobales bacterium]|nr:50S ribosomal protein L18 [Terriglobales bacterium]
MRNYSILDGFEDCGEIDTMLTRASKNDTRQRVHQRIRKKMMGTPERPRLNVYRSLNHIYVQLVDDMEGKTLVFASSAEGKKGEGKTGGNLAAAKEVGKKVAQRAQEKGIKQVVFDRGGYLYHGRIKALADAAREAGLQF